MCLGCRTEPGSGRRGVTMLPSAGGLPVASPHRSVPWAPEWQSWVGTCDSHSLSELGRASRTAGGLPLSGFIIRSKIKENRCSNGFKQGRFEISPHQGLSAGMLIRKEGECASVCVCAHTCAHVALNFLQNCWCCPRAECLPGNLLSVIDFQLETHLALPHRPRAWISADAPVTSQDSRSSWRRRDRAGT